MLPWESEVAVFVPYVFFNGQCAQAMAFYAEVFSAEVQLIRYRDMPPGEGGEDFAQSDAVMHACLSCEGGALLWGSDYPDGMTMGVPQGMYAARDFVDYDQAARIFVALAEGGRIVWPWGPMFWTTGFGMCVDRFGVPWMIAALEEPARGGAVVGTLAGLSAGTVTRAEGREANEKG